MDTPWIWLDGEFLHGGDFQLSCADRGVTHGLGLFETVLAIGGQPQLWDRHMARLQQGCARLHIPDLDSESLYRGAVGLLARQDLLERPARLRIAVSAGEGSLFDLTTTQPRVWMVAMPYTVPTSPLRLTRSPWLRNERSPLAGLKCASYAENLCALDEARRRGFDEVLQFNTRHELCEAAMANVFVVRRGEVATPPLNSGCLPGVMRARVFELCREAGMTAVEAVLTEDDLLEVEEVFLTSALRGISPVVCLDGLAFPAPGPVTRLLQELLEAARC